MNRAGGAEASPRTEAHLRYGLPTGGQQTGEEKKEGARRRVLDSSAYRDLR